MLKNLENSEDYKQLAIDGMQGVLGRVSGNEAQTLKRGWGAH